MSRKCERCPLKNTAFCYRINPFARKYSAADKRWILKNALEPDRYYAFELNSQKSSLVRGDRVKVNAYVSRLNRDNPSERWVVLRI